MVSAYRDAQSFIAALADMAEALRLAILAMPTDAERSDHLMKLVAESDMVFGVWPDPDRADGFGVQLIIGEDMTPPLVGFETKHDIRIAAIPCAGRDVAVVAREAWGVSAVQDDGGEAQRTASAKLAVSAAERLKWASLHGPAPPP